MPNAADPKQLLDNAPMSSFQKGVVLVCLCLFALDGFDILAISFASPGIAAEWQINRAALGVVLGMELLGMAIGSVSLGALADRIGRRPTILLCLLIMAGGMFAAALVLTIYQLLAVRFVTGLGIGGMLAATNAVVAECTNRKHRNLAVILSGAGFPLGVIAGGAISTQLLTHFDWRAIFLLGGSCTSLFIIVVWYRLPESIEYLLGKQPPGALDKVNHTLNKMGHSPLAQLPKRTAEKSHGGYAELFSPRFRSLTLLLIFGYFAHIMTFYYIIKWIPKIVVDMGYHAASAGSILVWANVGGAVGAITLGLLATRVKLTGVLSVVLVFAFLMVSAFGAGYESLAALALVAAATGFFTNAGVVGFYALLANAFPTSLRARGTGIVIGLGRGGAALGPVVAGLLFETGAGLQTVSVLMATGALLAAMTVIALRFVGKRSSGATDLN